MLKNPFPKVTNQLQHRAIGIINGKFTPLSNEQLNRGFFSRVINKKPFVTLKLGVSIDGATAMESGESQWITGESARKDVQKLRASSGAILTGSGTIKIDNPSLTVRDETLKAIDPIRVIIDTKLQTSPDAKIYQDDKTTWIFCVDDENKTLFLTVIWK